MGLVWLLDRATGLVAYPALYAAVLTGIFYNTRRFGALHEAARSVHVEVSTLATVLLLAHGALGLADTWLVATGASPPPTYSTPYLYAGVAVGVGALALVVVSVLGFLDAKRFERPWGPRTVHAFAYAGFAFATVHAVAVGTDVAALVRPGIVAGVGFLAYVLLVRLLAERDTAAAT